MFRKLAGQGSMLDIGEGSMFRLIGSSPFIRPIHIHGDPLEITATDGYPVPEAARLTKGTALVGLGERYDLAWTVRNPGE